MKSGKIMLIVLLSCFFAGLNAQVFVGGNFSLATTGGSTSTGNITTDKQSSFNFTFSPKAGKFLSEKLAVGAELDLSFLSTKTPGYIDVVNKSSSVGIVPFVRYYAIKSGNFSVFGQGNVGFSFIDTYTKTGSTTNDGPRGTRLFLSIVPGLAYDLNDKLSLETSLNFFSIGCYNLSIKDGSNKDKTSGFEMGAGLNDIVTIGDISVGAIYKF